MIVETDWLIGKASVLGKGHADGGLPNQDAVCVMTSPDGKILAAVVSDGAGTASKSATGSQTIAVNLAQCLLQAGMRAGTALPRPEVLADSVRACIIATRQQLDATGEHLRDYHATLVGVLITQHGGCVAQIGDSIGLASCFATVKDSAGKTHAEYFPENGYTLFEAERGEYANETHFFTEANWSKHLRLHPLPEKTDGIVLMTDGAADLAMRNGGVFRGFLGVLMQNISSAATSNERDIIIERALADRRTYVVTGDDKTIFMALRSRDRALASLPVQTQDPLPSPLPSGQAPESSTKAMPPASIASSQQHLTEPARRITGNNGHKHTPPRNPPPHLPERHHKVRSGFLVVLFIALMCATAAAGWSLIKTKEKAGEHPGKPTPPIVQENKKPVSENTTTVIIAPPPSQEVDIKIDVTPKEVAKGATTVLSVTLLQGKAAKITPKLQSPGKGLRFVDEKGSCTTTPELRENGPRICTLPIKVPQDRKEKIALAIEIDAASDNSETLVRSTERFVLSVKALNPKKGASEISPGKSTESTSPVADQSSPSGEKK